MRNEIDPILNDLRTAIAEVERKHGIKVKFGNVRYMDTNFTTKMTVSKVGPAGKVQDPEYAALLQYARLDGLENITEQRDYLGSMLSLVGYRTRAYKRPYVVKNQDGNTYVYATRQFVQDLWGNPDKRQTLTPGSVISRSTN